MKPPIEQIVLVDEVRPSSFDGKHIPVTKDELDFMEEHIPFTLTHEYDKNSLAHKYDLLATLFHRAIKIENSFIAYSNKFDYLNYEVEKTESLLKPVGLRARSYNNDISTLFALKYFLSEAMEELSVDIPTSTILRKPDYYSRFSDLKNFRKVNAAMNVFDKNNLSFNPVFLFGSATTIKHNALKDTFSDVDTHLVIDIPSFQEYKNILPFVKNSIERRVPLSPNIIFKDYLQAYLKSDINYFSSTENAILKGGPVPTPYFSDDVIYHKKQIGVALNLLRTKKALLTTVPQFWDSSLSIFNAKGKKSNLSFAYMLDSHPDAVTDFKPYVSYAKLPSKDKARKQLLENCLEISNAFKQYITYLHQK